MLKQLCKGIWNIVCLRGGPQELPYSPLALVGLILTGILIAFLVSGKYVLLLASNMAVMLVMVWGLLYFLKKQDRYVQTMLALIGCGWFMSILFLVFWYGVLSITAYSGYVKGVSADNLIAIFSLEIQQNTLPIPIDAILILGIFVLLIWKLLVDIVIIRKATEWRILRTIGFILLLNLIPGLVQKNFIEPQIPGKTVVNTPVSSATPGNTIHLNK